MTYAKYAIRMYTYMIMLYFVILAILEFILDAIDLIKKITNPFKMILTNHFIVSYVQENYFHSLLLMILSGYYVIVRILILLFLLLMHPMLKFNN